MLLLKLLYLILPLARARGVPPPVNPSLHLAPFRNRARIVMAKLTFSNYFAPAKCERLIVTFPRRSQTAPAYSVNVVL